MHDNRSRYADVQGSEPGRCGALRGTAELLNLTLQIDGLECVSLADDRLSSIIIDQEGKEFVISERDTLADPLRSCHTHCQQGQGFEK